MSSWHECTAWRMVIIMEMQCCEGQYYNWYWGGGGETFLKKITSQQFLFLLPSAAPVRIRNWQPLLSRLVSQEESPHSGHDGGQFPPDWVHLWPPRHERHFEWLPWTAAPGHQTAPDSQEPLASQPRLQSLRRLWLPGSSLRALGGLSRSPAEDL